MTMPPDDFNLLSSARTELLEKILPHLSGPARYSALMVANALAISQRAAHAKEVLPDTGDAQLCAEIREGRFDPGQPEHTTLIQLLRQETNQRLEISNPKALNTRNRSQASERRSSP